MIIKLKFDLFYTTIEVPNIQQEVLMDNIYKKLNKWLKSCYKLQKIYALYSPRYYDDVAVIGFLKAEYFNDNENKVHILEKQKSIGEKSIYKEDFTIFF